ncbi:MAG TPA: PAS domain-containing sensor histidine kinase [Cytophagaceae bacterium]|jgi:PAS domain S-box-containing protein
MSADPNSPGEGLKNISNENFPSENTHENLKQSEERYRLLVEGVKDYAIIMLSPEGYIYSWNEGARLLYGYADSEILGKHFSILYTEQDLSKSNPSEKLKEAFKIGRLEDEGWRLSRDGHIFFATVVITPVFNMEGRLIGYSKITRDLTERKMAEEKLRRSEERHRLLIEGVKDYAIFMLSPDGYIQSWNEGARRMKGYEENEILGKHFSIFYPKDLLDKGFPDFELEETKRFGRFEHEGIRVRKGGSTFYANVIISSMYNSHGDLIGFSKITRDLTERKEAETKLSAMNSNLEIMVKSRTEELSSSLSELRRINSELDNFIYTASHDLKAPVMNIEGLVTTLKEMLLDYNFINTDVDNLLRMIDSSLQKFQRTITDLSSVSEIQKIDRDDKIEINLPELIEDIKGSIPHLIKEAGAHINVHAENIIGLRYTSIHIRSIIYNLLTNAIKYRSPDRPLVIDISSYTIDSFWILEMRDNGLGIKDENKNKIFEMFKRLHTHVEGSGIGLYIVKRIVDNVGGKIELTSEPNKGTNFKVFLPR